MQDRVRVAAVATNTRPGQINSNLDKIAVATAGAASHGAQLVLFPELSLTGFIPNHPPGEHEPWLRKALSESRRMAIRLESPAIDRLQAIAAEHKTWLSVGLLEDAGNVLYNCQVLVGPQGLAGRWRKMHVPMFEMPFYNPGPAPQVVDTPLGRIGANICFDALLPESTRLLAVQNVEIVLLPFAADPPPATVDAWAHWAGPAVRARAAENGVFAIACNYVGHVECAGVEQTFPGGALIVSPRGEVIAQWKSPSGAPGMVVADLLADVLSAARSEPEYLFRFRRPELYGPLCEQPRP